MKKWLLILILFTIGVQITAGAALNPYDIHAIDSKDNGEAKKKQNGEDKIYQHPHSGFTPVSAVSSAHYPASLFTGPFIDFLVPPPDPAIHR